MQDFDAYRKTARTPSGEVSYVDVGEGPVALFVHGVITGAYLWRNVIDQLHDEHRCVALDLPLHGKSPARPDQDFSVAALAQLLDEFCAAVGLSEVDLVANDTGGAIAQIFAAQHAVRLRTLTLTNCDVQDQAVTEPLRQFTELVQSGQLAPLGVEAAQDPATARILILGSGYEHVESVSDETVRTFLEPVLGTLEKGRAFQRLLRSMDVDAGLKSIEAKLRQLAVPTLIVWGTGDVFFETRAAYRLRDTIPGASEVVEVEGAKLFFPDERPDDLVPHLRRHWAAHPAAQATA